MNDKIKELKDQCYIPIVDRDGDTEYDMEKFAELIVRECCQYLDNEAERLYSLSGSEVDPVFQSNFEICAEKCYDNSQGIKEHFGVEE